MIAVDLAAAAADEARRLTGARALATLSRPFVADGPLVGITHRHRVRTALGRRILLLYRCACEDAAGRLVHSTLVAMTIALRRNDLDVRRARWAADPSLLARIADECCAWRDAVNKTTGQFTATRLSRERAIASHHQLVTPSFQQGLFDRRAHRAQIALERDAADFSARLTARIAVVERAGALTPRSPELLLVLIPRDAARV